MKRNVTTIICWACAAAVGVGVFFFSDPAAGSSAARLRSEAAAPDDVYDADEFPGVDSGDRSDVTAELKEYREILCLLPRIFFAPEDDTGMLNPAAPGENRGGMVKNLTDMANLYRETAVLKNTFALLKLGGGGANGGDMSKNIGVIAQLYRQSDGTGGANGGMAPPKNGDTAKTLGEMMKLYRKAAETGNIDAAGF